ncbi:MAG TPA: rhodanese-like domain-containing protein [Candidatus Limnocylindria bacterium]|nr:rhodanese-like domain-containing protein [Candidatus Limnocylindria bacterium]
MLLALRILDAERSFGHEVEPFLRYVSPADDALAVLAALEAPQRLVDETQTSLEHRLPGEVELPRFGFARDVRGVLVGKGDISAALALGHGEALPDSFDGRCKVGTFALESLAGRIEVHVVSVRQNWLVVPEDVSKRRSEFHLLDVREQDEWDAGHIEGAQHIPLGELGSRLAEVPRERVVVAVCRSGSRSDRAAKGLRMSGFQAENLDGGVTAWSRAGLALVARGGGPGRVI